ncbi:MAG: glycosyltransferase, partial [Desulfobacterales bacterium]|nr:glycosyltransferase [Desulfobacterales bacterium]
NRVLDFYGQAVPRNCDYPAVSVIIPVGAASANLERCLAECLNQDYADYEIIVLPDADLSLKPDLAAHPKIRVLATGCVNPSVKRNLGASLASGDILAFLDDDAFPFYNWLGTGVRHFTNPAIAAVGGPAVTPAGSPQLEKVSGHIFASPAVSGRHRARYVPYKYQLVDDLPSCNLFVAASAFRAIGGFASGHWPGEDTLLCRAIAIQTRKKIIYDPFLVVEHRRRPVFRGHLAQVARYALHRGYFAKRWPENSCKPLYFIPSAVTVWIALGWPLCFLAPLRFLYPASLLFYLAVCGLFSLQLSGVKETLLTFTGTVLTHVTYGTLFMAGFFRSDLPEHKAGSTQPPRCLAGDEVDLV